MRTRNFCQKAITIHWRRITYVHALHVLSVLKPVSNIKCVLHPHFIMVLLMTHAIPYGILKCVHTNCTEFCLNKKWLAFPVGATNLSCEKCLAQRFKHRSTIFYIIIPKCVYTSIHPPTHTHTHHSPDKVLEPAAQRCNTHTQHMHIAQMLMLENGETSVLDAFFSSFRIW